MSRAIVWFRNDLRIRDNEALARAAMEYEEIIPVYILDSAILEGEGYGSKKIGPRRLNFILESIKELKNSLRDLGGDLLVMKGYSVDILVELAEKWNAKRIMAHKEATPEELEMESRLKERIPDDCQLKFFWGHTLFHINDIPFEYEKIPDVYTDFRKKSEKYSKVRPLIEAPEKIHLPSGLDIPEIPVLGELGFDHKPISDKAAIKFRGGEGEARKRLEEYFWETEKLAKYKETRNGLLGKNYSSKFSAWLAQGCISPRQIYFEVKSFEEKVKQNQSTYWLIFELIWRDYFRYVAAKYRKRLFYPGGIKNEKPEVRYDERKWNAWREGRTGVPFIDANMREINETGFMSNRGRQNVASYLIKDLKQDWRMGAAYFEQELIDYDVTSNWGNWAYVAGVGNDPRQDRYFNILSQANRYDSKGEYVKYWLPELEVLDENFVHTPWKLSAEELKEQNLDHTPYSDPVFTSRKW